MAIIADYYTESGCHVTIDDSARAKTQAERDEIWRRVTQIAYEGLLRQHLKQLEEQGAFDVGQKPK